MKLNIINNPTYSLELTEKEIKLLANCLNYCWHRLERHKCSGLHGVVDSSWVNHFRAIIQNKIGW